MHHKNWHIQLTLSCFETEAIAIYNDRLMLRGRRVGEGKNTIAEAATADFHRMGMRARGSEMHCLYRVTDAKLLQQMLIVIQQTVTLRPVAARDSGNRRRALFAHARVKILITQRLGSSTGGNLRQHLSRRRFITRIT